MIHKITKPTSKLFKEITDISNQNIINVIYWIEKYNFYIFKENNKTKGYVCIRKGKNGTELVTYKCYKEIEHKLLIFLENINTEHIILDGQLRWDI